MGQKAMPHLGRFQELRIDRIPGGQIHENVPLGMLDQIGNTPQGFSIGGKDPEIRENLLGWFRGCGWCRCGHRDFGVTFFVI
jgi:hypothetical protein